MSDGLDRSAGTPARPGRGSPFRQAARAVRKRLEETAARRGFAEADVLLHWPEIAGAALAGTCGPVRVTYGREGRGLGATLVVRAAGARAPEVEHLAPVILERVNAYYGYRAVARLRVTQAGQSGGRKATGVRPAGFAEPATPFEGPSGAQDQSAGRSDAYDRDALERARRMAAGVENPGLREALARLGARVLADGAGSSERTED